MTYLDSIVDAITAALVPLAPATVEVEPTGDPDAYPALDVTVNSWSVVDREPGATRRALSVTIGGYVERGDGKDASEERAALHAAAIAAVMTSAALTALVEIIDDDDMRMTTATLASQRRLGFAQDFTIQFVTSRTDPALPA